MENYYYVLAFLFGVVVNYYIVKWSKVPETNCVTTITSKRDNSKCLQKEGHIEPGFEHKDIYVNCTECRECKRTARFWFQHTAAPCPYCGGKVVEIGAAIWKKVDEVFQWCKK